MKKFIAIVLSLVFVLSLGTLVFADATKTKVTSTVGVKLQTANTTVPAQHTWKAIKLLDLYNFKDGSTVVTDGSGNAVYQYALNSALSSTQKANLTSALTNAGFSINSETGEIQKNNASIASNSADAKLLAATLAQFASQNNLSGTGIAYTVNTTSFTELPCGYYVIYESTKNASTNDGEVATQPILLDLRPESTSGVTLALKDATVTLDKSVDVDGQGDGDVTPAGQKSTLKYTITTNFPTYGTLPSSRTVSFRIQDAAADGITLNTSSLVVKVDGTAVTTASYFTTKTITASAIDIQFASDYILAHPGSTVTVEYTGSLNTSAAYNNASGNENTATITYPNNPVVSTETDTLTDTAKVYAYDMAFDKLDGATENALSGATFELHLYSGSTVGAVVPLVLSGGNYYACLKDGASGPQVVTASGSVTSFTTSGSPIRIYGLPEGTYAFVETTSPSGYSQLANPVIFTVTGDESNATTHELNGSCTIAVTNGTAKTEASGDSEGASKTSGSAGGVVHVRVRNYRGVNLPATGSTMSLILMIGGGVVVLAGIVALILISRKKKDDDEEATAEE